MGRVLKRWRVLVIVALVSASMQPAPHAAATNVALPAPFDDWDVVVEVDATNPNVYSLSFDSAVLALRERAVVWLPDGYLQGHERYPVVYHLHGTVATRTHPAVEDAVRNTTGAGIPLVVADGPVITAKTGGFDQTVNEHDFILVAPDAGDVPWCPACNWGEGVGDGPRADTYLHSELIPLVQAVFRTRTDRAGRGVIGHSMGGGGAIIQGFLHPDVFSFVGSSSGTLNVRDDAVSASQARWLYYGRTQGLGPPVVDEIRARGINALDLAANTVGTGAEVVAVIGDACLDPATANTGACEGRNPANDTANFIQEVYQRHGNNDLTATRLIQAGVPLTYIRREGNHGILDTTFRRYFLPRLNERFAQPGPEPEIVSYHSIATAFNAWGYGVEIRRPNTEFFHLLDARTDGRSVVLAGGGQVRLQTPATFRPGGSYEVVVTPAGGAPAVRSVTADAGGRLVIDVDLGSGRDVDEHSALIAAGQFIFDQARIEVRG